MVRGLLRKFQNVILTGLAIVLPLAITLYIIWFVINWLRGALLPVVELLERLGVIGFVQRRELITFLIDVGIYSDVIGFLSEIIAILLFVTLVIVVGALARYRYGEFLVGTIDYFIATIPGIGTVYQTLRRVGTMVLGDTASEFEGVKLLELLSDDTYVLAFQTNQSPDSVTEATGNDEMMTLFVPMAPNPVTGGFLVYVPIDRVIDVDLTVDQAVRAILTSGIATEDVDMPGQDHIRMTGNSAIIDELSESSLSDESTDSAGSTESDDSDHT